MSEFIPDEIVEKVLKDMNIKVDLLDDCVACPFCNLFVNNREYELNGRNNSTGKYEKMRFGSKVLTCEFIEKCKRIAKEREKEKENE